MGLDAEAGFDLGQGQAVDAEEFLARFVAAENGDGAARETEFVGEKLAEDLVGAALDGRRMNLHLQRLAQPADDSTSRGVWDGLDGERARRSDRI